MCYIVLSRRRYYGFSNEERNDGSLHPVGAQPGRFLRLPADQGHGAHHAPFRIHAVSRAAAAGSGGVPDGVQRGA